VGECTKTVEDTEPLISEMQEKVKLLEDRKNNEKAFQVGSDLLLIVYLSPLFP